LRIKNFLQ